VGEQQRQRARTATFSLHHVQYMTRDLSTLLTQSVEPALKSAGVKHTPVLQYSFQPVAGHASVPARPEVHRPSIAIQPAAELAQRIGGQPRTLLNDSQTPVIVHATHPDMPPRSSELQTRGTPWQPSANGDAYYPRRRATYPPQERVSEGIEDRTLFAATGLSASPPPPASIAEGAVLRRPLWPVTE
jgi:hypothetical protein